MPTGTFGGFPFDPEVYGSFVDQEPVFTDSIMLPVSWHPTPT